MANALPVKIPATESGSVRNRAAEIQMRNSEGVVTMGILDTA